LIINKIKSALSVGILVQITLLAFHIWITPLMSIEDRADFAMVNAVAITVVFLSGFGFQTSLIRKFSLQRISKKFLRKTFFYSLFHLAICISISTLILAFYGLKQVYFLLVHAVIFLLIAKIYLQSAFLGSGKNAQFQTSKVLPVATLLFAVVIASLRGPISLEVLMSFWIASEFMALLFLVSRASLITSDLKLLKTSDPFYEDFVFGAKAMAGNNSFIEVYKIDQIILGFFASPLALAVFAVAKSICSSMRFISQSLSQILLPILLKEQSDLVRLKILLQFISVGSACSILAGSFMVAVADLYLVDIVGPKYRAANSLLLGMAISYVFFLPRRLIYEFWKASNRPLATSAYEVLTLIILLISAMALSQTTLSIQWVFIYSSCLANIFMFFVAGASLIRNFTEAGCR